MSGSARTWVLRSVRALVAVALGVGVGFATLVVLPPGDSLEAAQAAAADPLTSLSSDRLDQTVAELRSDGVSVSDDGRAILDEEGERVVEEAVRRVNEAGTARVYVVVWAPRQELGAQEDDIVELMAERLVRDPDVDRGVLLVWQGPQEGYFERLGDRYDVYTENFYSSFDFLGDPAVTLPRIIDELAAAEYGDRGADVEDAADDDRVEAVGDVGDVVLGVLLAGALLVAAEVARRRLGSPSRRPDPGAWRPRSAAR